MVRASGATTTVADPTPDPITPEPGFRVVQRTLMRGDQELDVRSLYVWSVTTLASGDPASDASALENEGGAGKKTQSNYSAADVGLMGYGRVTENDQVVVEPGRRVTFGAYFNAFPAGYWRRWTNMEEVRLEVRVRGEGTVIVSRSTSKGHVLRTSSTHVDTSKNSETLTMDLPLAPFIDGGWYWFDIEGGDAELTLEAAQWSFRTDKQAVGRVTVGITTFNRPDFCVAQLKAMAADESLQEILDEVIVVDQGTNRVSDDADFPATAKALGEKLRVLSQPNLGGSGGFSRAMSEAVQKGSSDYVLLLDDDVVCELDGIRRAVAFADLAKGPTLVGGHMFSLYDRTVMHAYGETIAKWRWFWGPAPATPNSHDFARMPLRSTKWLHRRVDVDYSGWWMCLIPTQVIKEIGLALPMFIKWDDAECGIRAGQAGFPTVSLPGAAVWHVPWTEKDDTLDWQAYFHQRNRLISGILHSPFEHGGRLVQESLENHVKRLMAMQYSTGEVIMMALSDVLDGPERMHRDLRHRLGEIRELRSRYEDAQPRDGLDLFPAPHLKKPRRKGKGIANPTAMPGKVMMAATGLLRQLRSPRELAAEVPEGIIPHVDQRWYRMAHFDSAIVSSADGTTAAWHHRDRKQFVDQLNRSVKLHMRLYREWGDLRDRYREALPELTSPDTWAASFSGEQE